MTQRAVVGGLEVFRTLLSREVPCPVHPQTKMDELKTTNEWVYYCPLCDVRYNRLFEVMPR